MKKIVLDVGGIKDLRINSEPASTQKELAHEVRVWPPSVVTINTCRK